MAELRKEDLWVMADKLRNNMDSAEYKHVCLGLICKCQHKNVKKFRNENVVF